MNLSSFGLGFTMGFGTGLVARDLFPIAREIVRPVGRFAVRSGLRVVEYSRETLAHLGETIEDTLAEVRAEFRGQPKRRVAVKSKRSKRAREGRGAEVTEIRRTA